MPARTLPIVALALLAAALLLAPARADDALTPAQSKQV